MWLHGCCAALQDKHTDMMAAFEAALSAQSSKYATVSKQLRLELKEALVKANQVGRNGQGCSAIRLGWLGLVCLKGHGHRCIAIRFVVTSLVPCEGVRSHGPCQVTTLYDSSPGPEEASQSSIASAAMTSHCRVDMMAGPADSRHAVSCSPGCIALVHQTWCMRGFAGCAGAC